LAKNQTALPVTPGKQRHCYDARSMNLRVELILWTIWKNRAHPKLSNEGSDISRHGSVCEVFKKS
jgi:hypothetical protein